MKFFSNLIIVAKTLKHMRIQRGSLLFSEANDFVGQRNSWADFLEKWLIENTNKSTLLLCHDHCRCELAKLEDNVSELSDNWKTGHFCARLLAC